MFPKGTVKLCQKRAAQRRISKCLHGLLGCRLKTQIFSKGQKTIVHFFDYTSQMCCIFLIGQVTLGFSVLHLCLFLFRNCMEALKTRKVIFRILCTEDNNFSSLVV